MKLTVILVLTLSLIVGAHGQSGEELYNSVCAACHTINQGRLVGPDLTGVYNKQDMPWLIGFIRSSQQMIKSKDPAAVAIFEEYNKLPMPDNNLSDQQIISIIDYIRSVDASVTAKIPGDTAKPDSLATVSDTTGPPIADTIRIDRAVVMKGRDYFYGKIPFQGKAVSCMSCHRVNDGSLFGGGKLAINLTGAYTKLGPAGIKAILSNPPFPAMKMSTKGALTEEEISSLSSFLKSFSVRSHERISSIGGMSFLVTGLLGGLFIVTFLFLLYDNRKIPPGIS